MAQFGFDRARSASRIAAHAQAVAGTSLIGWIAIQFEGLDLLGNARE